MDFHIGGDLRVRRLGFGAMHLSTEPGPAREQALRSLRVERIELRRIDPATPLADQLGTLRELHAAGKVGAVRGDGLRAGCSIASTNRCCGPVPRRASHSCPGGGGPGGGRIAHLEENVAAAELQLSPAQQERLDATA